MTWPSLTQTGIRTSFRAERTLTPNQSVICVEIDLAGPLRRLHETLHSIATYVMTPSRRLAAAPAAAPYSRQRNRLRMGFSGDFDVIPNPPATAGAAVEMAAFQTT
jgi:hypothetical protein